jgi:hypothetical protein
MADDNNCLNGVGDVGDTILNNAGGIADVLTAMNKNGTSSTLATPGAPAAPATKVPDWAGLGAGAKAAIIAAAAALARFLLILKKIL